MRFISVESIWNHCSNKSNQKTKRQTKIHTILSHSFNVNWIFQSRKIDGMYWNPYLPYYVLLMPSLKLNLWRFFYGLKTKSKKQKTKNAKPNTKENVNVFDIIFAVALQKHPNQSWLVQEITFTLIKRNFWIQYFEF